MAAAWFSGNGVARAYRRSYPTSGPVSTGMGDCSRVRVALAPSRYLINHPGELSLAVPSWVYAMSKFTGDGHGHC